MRKAKDPDPYLDKRIRILEAQKHADPDPQTLILTYPCLLPLCNLSCLFIKTTPRVLSISNIFRVRCRIWYR
jgi:hypothetical protein